MRSKAKFTALAACLSLVLAGCATTRIETTGTPLPQPLCAASSGNDAVSVLWATRWRPDQKEPPLREAAALRGIEAFFASQHCFRQVRIRHIDLPLAGEYPSAAQLVSLAGSDAAPPDKVVLIVVRELGPKLWIGLPKLIEGGTEVVLEVKVVNGVGAGSLADLRTHWQKGGPFYIKGVKTLDQDMQTTLQGVLASAVPVQ